MKNISKNLLLCLGAVCLLILSSCVDIADDSEEGLIELGDPGDCIVVDMSVSSEKIELLTELAESFNSGDSEVDGKCVFVRPQKKASGGAMQLLATDWDEEIEGPKPVVWSPAASTWGPILNAKLKSKGEPEMVGEGKPFMLTPLVIAMPEPMAQAMGWPDTAIGWADILDLTQSEEGWAKFGHPEWGEFRLGKTNPNFSTSGLSALIAQTYAATGKSENLTSEDLKREEVIQFGTGVEEAVVHYGDTTLTFLNNWYRADSRGAALSYVSAAAVEEKSVVDYNLGNPDGVLDLGEEPRPPKIPLVAIYPKEGTIYSDNPFFVLDADWVDENEKMGAELFQTFVQKTENQEKVLEFGFRPGNPNVEISDPISAENGLNPDEPRQLLEVPSSEVMVSLLDRWGDQRKGARVTLVVDVSGSMGEFATQDSRDTKLELAKKATLSALDEFKDDDLIGLTIFTTDENATRSIITEVVPVSRFGDQKQRLRQSINGLTPKYGTPLFEVIKTSYSDAVEGYDPTRINAIVVLSDGVNDDGNFDDDNQQLTELINLASIGGEGQISRPVRIFPIAYGQDADSDTLENIAESTSSAVYDASDPRSIEKVFAEVISNF